jgi:hypothetical protein
VGAVASRVFAAVCVNPDELTAARDLTVFLNTVIGGALLVISIFG